jgi:hypothetical protein
MKKSRFHFYISGEEKEVLPGSALWELPLSGKGPGRDDVVVSGLVRKGREITVGDYFSASCRFLSRNGFLILISGLNEVLQKPVLYEHIHQISVFLEKHGAFYHPLKIRVDLTDTQTCFFVLNGAVGNPGLSLIEKEVSLISKLNQSFPKQYLPLVFGLDILRTPKGIIGFFLGEWFQDYKEFHVTSGNGERQIVIWESDGNCHHLPEQSVLPVYREAARILTYYYDLETFEQVWPWHHAAGDFVVREAGGQFQVRLITVRGYSPLSEFGVGEIEKKNHILPSLLVFFFNLSLRMRLDRMDGTGEAVMLGDGVIKATVDGFLDALNEKSKTYEYGDLRRIFISFFNGFSLDLMVGICITILESGEIINPAENGLIKGSLESHCRIMQEIFKTV